MKSLKKNLGKLILATLLLYVANSQAVISPKELEISIKLGEAKALCSINAFPQAQEKIAEIPLLLKQQAERLKLENIISSFFCTQAHKQIQELETYITAQLKIYDKRDSNAQKRKDAIGAFSDSQEELVKKFG